MRKEDFFEYMKTYFFSLPPYTLTSNPTILRDIETGEVTKYSSIEDAYSRAVINGEPLHEIVESNSKKYIEKHMYICLDDGDLKF